MKRFTVLALAIAMIVMVAGSAFAVTTVVRGAYNSGSAITTTLTSSTTAVAILATGSNAYYGNKTFTIYNPTGGTTTLFTIEGSADNSHWFTIDATGNVAAAAGAYKAVINTVVPYMRVRGVLTGNGVSTPECYWFGITN